MISKRRKNWRKLRRKDWKRNYEKKFIVKKKSQCIVTKGRTRIFICSRFKSCYKSRKKGYRVKEVLPSSPWKKQEVVKLLFKQLSLTKEESRYRTKSINKIPEDTTKVARRFYQRDNISRMALVKEIFWQCVLVMGKKKCKKDTFTWV